MQFRTFWKPKLADQILTCTRLLHKLIYFLLNFFALLWLLYKGYVMYIYILYIYIYIYLFIHRLGFCWMFACNLIRSGVLETSFGLCWMHPGLPLHAFDCRLFLLLSLPVVVFVLIVAVAAVVAVVVAVQISRSEIAAKTNSTSVPKVWVKGNFIGGCNDGATAKPVLHDAPPIEYHVLLSAGNVQSQRRTEVEWVESSLCSKAAKSRIWGAFCVLFFILAVPLGIS